MTSDNGTDGVRQAIQNVFTGSEPDEHKTVVDALTHIGEAAYRVANAITDQAAGRGRDENGGYVGCLTEAVMGVSSALNRIANAIELLAQAVESHGES